jgi:hypothetical protein
MGPCLENEAVLSRLHEEVEVLRHVTTQIAAEAEVIRFAGEADESDGFTPCTIKPVLRLSQENHVQVCDASQVTWMHPEQNYGGCGRGGFPVTRCGGKMEDGFPRVKEVLLGGKKCPVQVETQIGGPTDRAECWNTIVAKYRPVKLTETGERLQELRQIVLFEESSRHMS